jgi:hypothetical protein
MNTIDALSHTLKLEVIRTTWPLYIKLIQCTPMRELKEKVVIIPFTACLQDDTCLLNFRII